MIPVPVSTRLGAAPHAPCGGFKIRDSVVMGPHGACSLKSDLGLHGIPAESLVEFEGGGSMLSYDTLGGMLAASEPGVLNTRRQRTGVQAGNAKENARNWRRWGRGIDLGPTEAGKWARLLCQADALEWWRNSPQARLPGPVPLHKMNGGDSDEILSGSPGRRKARVKLYDHRYNPRVLRSVVTETAVTGLAGGILRVGDEQGVESLKKELRIAQHRATELEDQIFQSQTGTPRRELLGDPQRLQGRRQVRFSPRSSGGHGHEGSSPELQYCRPEPDRPPPPARADGSGRYRSYLSHYCSPRRIRPAGMLSPPRTLVDMAPALGSARRHSLPLQLTHEGSHARHLSSLQSSSSSSSLSSSGARVAWGLAESVGQPEEPLVPAPPGSAGSEKWPVLFAVGDTVPTDRHPLGVYSLPHFDDGLLLRLAEASSMPPEEILVVAAVLEGLKGPELRRSVKLLFRAQHALERKRSAGPRPRVRGRRAGGGPRQAWLCVAGGGAAEDGEGPEEPVILSHAAARRALTSGLLAGAFGTDVVADILRVSRPKVVFDSTRDSPTGPSQDVPEAAAADEEVSRHSARSPPPTGSESGVIGPGRHEDRTPASRGGRPCGTGTEGSTGGTPSLGDNPSNSASIHEVHPPPSPAGTPAASLVGSLGRLGAEKVPDGEGALLHELVRATAARFRVHSAAVGLCNRRQALASRPAPPGPRKRGPADRGAGAAPMGGPRGREAPGDGDELGLPPCKVRKRGKGCFARELLPVNLGAGSAAGAFRPGGGGPDEYTLVRPRSTPRFLRPGFKVRASPADPVSWIDARGSYARVSRRRSIRRPSFLEKSAPRLMATSSASRLFHDVPKPPSRPQ